MRVWFARYVIAFAALIATASSAMGQPIFYTFESGINGDGFSWPASPTGLLPAEDFGTPDGVYFYNYTGNNLFFDNQYQVAGNSSLIDGEAMWGNPLDTDGGTLDIDLHDLGAGSVAFNFAWSVSGSPDATPDYLDVFLEDSEGRSTVTTFIMNDTFPGFGGFDGYQGTFETSIDDLFDDFEGVDGGQFIDIAYMYIDLSPIIDGGSSSEFAIDNFSIDGGIGGGDGELFPSVNGGSIDVTGSILSSSVLRGSGQHTMGVSVTNGTNSQTTFSTELVPGGDFSDAGQVTDAVIDPDQTIFNPDLVTISRSLPSGEYRSDLTIINTGDPSDPDNTITLATRLHEAPDLSGNFGEIDVNANDQIQLANAAAPVDGYRASVQVVDTSVTGPFFVTNFSPESPVKPGETRHGAVVFLELGQLSGTYEGTFTAELAMTAFTGVDNDIQVFLSDAEPVDDVMWNLTYTLADRLSKSEAVANGISFASRGLLINNTHTAAGIIDGSSSSNQTVSLSFVPAQEAAISIGGEPTPIGSAVDVDFTIPGDLFVLRLTYNEDDLPGGASEDDLRVLFDDDGTLIEAILANSDGGVGDMFVGSYNDYLLAEGGSPALSDFGIDVDANQVWAVLDFDGVFHVGLLDFLAIVSGDMNGDGTLDAFDVADFELALADRAAYDAAYPDLDADMLGDFTGDGVLDAFDVAGFEVALAGGATTLVPEPAAIALMGLGLTTLTRRRNRTAR